MTKYRVLFFWEKMKLTVSEFFWQFHPRRNRLCKFCGDFIGNSSKEENTHRCASASLKTASPCNF